MIFDPDPATRAWFERALSHPNHEVRRAAVSLLGFVDTDERLEWLELADGDVDPGVRATAVLSRAYGERDDFELLESDFADGVTGADLEWQWEYSIVVTDGLYVPSTIQLAWLTSEDDVAAKRVALMRASRPGEQVEHAVVLIVGKRLVNRYTRSARSAAEAMIWRNQGRPRYTGP